MWILKGVLLGLGLFLVGSFIYVVKKLGPIGTHKATSVDLLRFLTIGNVWFWVALALSVIACIAIVGFWPRANP